MKAGVTRRQVEKVGVGLAAEGQIKLVGLIADALQDDLLGFHLARDADLREIGLLYYVLNSSDRLGDALRRAERYCAIINEGVRLRVREGKELALALTYGGVERLSDRRQIECFHPRLQTLDWQNAETSTRAREKTGLVCRIRSEALIVTTTSARPWTSPTSSGHDARNRTSLLHDPSASSVLSHSKVRFRR